MRLPPLRSLTSEQQALVEEIARSRPRGLVGPFSVLIRSPRIASAANRLHNTFRFETRLDRRLFELAIIVVARAWSAEYAWRVHEEAALKEGLDPATVAALRAGRKPAFEKPDEAAIYDATTELIEQRVMQAATARRLGEHLDPELLVEFVSTVGFYSMLCMVLTAFEVSPAGEPPD